MVMVCAALSGRQGRRGAQRDVVHRASVSTHPVGRRAPPFGSRPGARPRRRGPQPYSPIRFSARSWRIERPGCDAGRDHGETCGLGSAPEAERGTMKLEGKSADRHRVFARHRRLHRAALRARGRGGRRGRPQGARACRGGGRRDRGRGRQGPGLPRRHRHGRRVRAPGAGGDRGLRHGRHPGEQRRHLRPPARRGSDRGGLGRPARAQPQGARSS